MNEHFIIYHNGICTKSKGALELLQERNIPHEVRWYLTDPLTKEEITLLLKKLSLDAYNVIRKTEPLFTEHFHGKDLTEAQWIAVLAEHPILLERPIVEKGDHAVIARPAEQLLRLL